MGSTILLMVATCGREHYNVPRLELFLVDFRRRVQQQ